MIGSLRPRAWHGWAVPAVLESWTPPLRRREFWVVQALVLGIAIAHAVLEVTHVIDLRGADFVPVSLYLLPVVYAALNFGIRGSAPTAVWSFLLTLPNAYLWHRGAGAAGELWQAALVIGVGLFVGHRVDRERTAREDAELRERERRASEARYRGLFDAAADPILVLDTSGDIVEANAAALALLGRTSDDLRRAPLDSLGPGIRRALGSAENAPRAPLAIDRPGGRIWIEPTAVAFQDAEGQSRILAQLRDVTPAVERQHLLETFARRTVAAREEERRRVARDLHDGPLQSLMLLWRTLDEIGSAAAGKVRETLHDARREAEDVADELRRFSRDLRPSVLDDLGLAPALKAETTTFASRAGVDASFEFTGTTDRLPIEIELTLLRICQEALRNVERHARAKHATVVLERSADAYRLLVADDGIGAGQLAPPDELVAAGRLGVVGMQERARLVGATCAVRSAAPWSTVVEVTGEASTTHERYWREAHITA